ncbi:hypothetical protein BD560DRAFT_235844 [Blakeslea trispora]|nr:hypothetical protein BD560DRAFT_235844 [Blakeslea trispora]
MSYLTLLKQGQFYWWLGHISVLLNGLVYFSSILSFYTRPLFYKYAFISVLLSYSIVLYHVISINKPGFKAFLSDPNLHYFIMAFYWFSCAPITVALIPFFLNSIVHSIVYIQPTLPATVNHSLHQWIQGNYRWIKQWIVYTEVILIPAYLVLQLILWRVSVLSLIVYIYFLQSRYTQSTDVQVIVHQTVRYLDNRLLNKQQPVFVVNLYSTIKQLIAS